MFALCHWGKTRANLFRLFSRLICTLCVRLPFVSLLHPSDQADFSCSALRNSQWLLGFIFSLSFSGFLTVNSGDHSAHQLLSRNQSSMGHLAHRRVDKQRLLRSWTWIISVEIQFSHSYGYCTSPRPDHLSVVPPCFAGAWSVIWGGR